MKGDSEITSAVEVVHLLRQMIRTRELLNASFNEGRDSITTLLLEADRDGDRLVFDGSRDGAINRAIIAASRVVFSGSLYGAKIQFHAAPAREISYRGAPALLARLPATVRKVQNREAFRVRTTGANCSIAVPGRGYRTFPLSEMSVGGTQVLLDFASDVFQLGQTIDCVLGLGSQTSVRCKLEVRGFKRLPAGRLGMGCRFVGLAPSDELLISRYVAQQERGSIARSSFFGL
ncbi:MAG TPA: flagellar brake protein [Rhodocyclaceae bacterium]